MRKRFVLALSGALLATATATATAPVLAAEDPGLALTAPIEEAPLSWGDAVMTAPAPPAAEEALPAEAADAEPWIDVTQMAISRGAPADDVRPEPPPPPPTRRAADQVADLTVRADRLRPQDQTVEKCVTGPAWWRVSNAAATVWIMATPDRAPLSTQFDDTCLRKRVAAAGVVILPAQPAGAFDPFSRGQTPLRPANTPLDQRISPALWGQLSRRIDNNPIRAADDRDWARVAPVQDLPPGVMRGLIPGGNGRSRGEGFPSPTVNSPLRQFSAPSHMDAIPPPGAPRPVVTGWVYPGDVPRFDLTKPEGADWIDYTLYRFQPRTTLQVIRDTPHLYAPPIVVAQRLSRAFDLPGRIGNPAADRAASLGAAGNKLVGRTANSAAQFADMTYLSDPDAADQEACLKKVADGLDAGRTGLGTLSQIESWADGDQTLALRRMNVLSTCQFGDLSVRFWSSVVAQYMEMINRALDRGGVAVAIVEYDPLFMRGGVMERLKEKGLRIQTPEQLK